jgi:hypothetical protein
MTYPLEDTNISHTFLSILYLRLKMHQLFLLFLKHADGNELCFMAFTAFPCTTYHSYYDKLKKVSI